MVFVFENEKLDLLQDRIKAVFRLSKTQSDFYM